MASFTNTFNTGTDQSISIYASSTSLASILGGGATPIVTLDGKRSMFEMEAQDQLLKGEVIDDGGVPDHRVLPDGWVGRVEVEKQSDNFGLLYAFLEENAYSGGAQNYFQIVETIRSPKPGGAPQRYQYVNCVFHGYKPGTWQKKQITKASVQIAASKRVNL